MANSFLINPVTQFFNPTTGAFLSQGKLYSYIANSSTPTPTYPTLLDANNSTNPNTNPVILSDTGTAIVVLSGGTKLTLQDAQGNQVWSVDNLNTAGTAANIYDNNGNPILFFTATANAVNYLNITNAAADGSPILSATGADTNVGLTITGKGTGNLTLRGATTSIVGNLTISGNSTVTGNETITGNASVSGTSVVTGAATFNGGITVNGSNNLVPSGFVTWFAGTTAPTSWLPCNGAAVSRTTYAGLFAAIGVVYGAGDGVTTFNVPTSARRTLMGSGGSGTGTIGSTVGSTGGEESHVLTTTEMPSHSHSYNEPVYNVQNISSSGASTNFSNGATTSSTGVQGSNVAHNNIQPSIVMLMIIRT